MHKTGKKEFDDFLNTHHRARPGQSAKGRARRDRMNRRFWNRVTRSWVETWEYPVDSNRPRRIH